MGTFFAYIIKTALFLVVYYLFYKLLLSRETFHRFNRIALVSLLLLSFLLPLTTSLIHLGKADGEGMITIEDLSTMATAVEDLEIPAIPTSHLIITGLMLVYLLGILVFTVRSLVSYISLARMLRKGERQVLEDGSILCLQDQEIAPFSWMHYIVANRKDLEENGKAILNHELGHIHNHHTLDLILTEVALILQWFNPAIWLMRQELQAIHEYEADEAVLDQGIDAKSYQLLLIKKAAGSRLQSITNSLHQSSIKKRITMMLKKKSNPWARAKYLFALPVAALSVAVLATPKASEISSEISECKVNELFANYQIPGEKNATSDLISDETSQPVFIVDGFKVDNIDDINPSDIESIEVVKDKAWVEDLGYADASGVVLVRMKANTSDASSANSSDVSSANSKDDVFNTVEVMPEYPGGMEAMIKFLSENIKYPEQMKKDSIEGRVILSFVVEKDGSITEVEEVRSPHPVLTEEAIRVVKLMPKWTPGKQRGKTVRVKFMLPINFQIPVEYEATATWESK